MEALRWGEAKAVLDNALTAAPDDPAVLMAAGELHLRLGAYDDAIAFYRHAAERGDPRAAAQAVSLAEAVAVEASLANATPETNARAAGFWAGNGAPGRALSIMEAASAQHPGDQELAGRVVELWRFYGLD
jgi:tetratricopeptide (TPR) repeat protein